MDSLPASRDWGLVVDGVFGIGLQREVTGRYAEWIAGANEVRAPILSLDVPSGLDSDTGRVLGCAVRADHTISFIALKPGLLTLDGPDCCGELHVNALGLDDRRRPSPGRRTGVCSPRRFRRAAATPTRATSAASASSAGDRAWWAALLASRAALKLGAGRVYSGLLARDAPLLDLEQPELTPVALAS